MQLAGNSFLWKFSRTPISLFPSAFQEFLCCGLAIFLKLSRNTYYILAIPEKKSMLPRNFPNAFQEFIFCFLAISFPPYSNFPTAFQGFPIYTLEIFLILFMFFLPVCGTLTRHPRNSQRLSGDVPYAFQYFSPHFSGLLLLLFFSFL